MLSIWESYWKVLKLDPEPFIRVKEAREGFQFALKFFMIIGLIAGLGKWAGIGPILSQPALSEQVYQVAARIETQATALLPPFLAQGVQQITGLIRAVGDKLVAIQPPLGWVPSRLIQLFGEWLATPFELLTKWFAVMLIVWVIARLLGGQGELVQHVSLLALAVAPQVLTLANYVVIGSGTTQTADGIFARILSLIAVVWSLIIFVQALAIAHNFEIRRSVMVWALFLGVIFIIGPLVSALVGGYILFGI